MGFSWILPQCSKFDLEDIDKIIAAAIRVLEKTPWTIDGTGEFMGFLGSFGCEVRGKKVQFPIRVVEKTLDRIKQEREQKATSGQAEKEQILPTQIEFSTSGQALWCCDPETDQLRAATEKDLANLCRVINSFPGLDRSHPTFIPQDAPLMTRELHSFVTIMLNSDKPYRVSAYSPEVVKYFVEALTIYYGSEKKALANLLLPCKVWINTPFMISRETIEAPMEIRRLTGQPLVYNPMPVVGIATPVTPAGALVLITAEVLGVNAISLAVDDCLCGWCAGPLSFDMKTGIHNQWGPETIVIGTAQTHIAARLFGTRPSVRATLGTGAKTPGAQSMCERSFGVGMGVPAGIRSFGGLATLAHSDVGSLVQLMMDMELMQAVAKLVEGFCVDEEEMAEELIVELASKGAVFLDTEHTAKYFRRYQWFPELMDRRVPMSWKDNPSTMLKNARKKALHLIKTAPNKCPLDPTQKTELAKLLRTADKELGEAK